MRYLLVVGFDCDVYKKEPRARIFVDNKLIDEIIIKHFPDEIFVKNLLYDRKNIRNSLGIKKEFLEPLTEEEILKINNFSINNFLNNKTKNNYFYELDIDDNLKEINLSIEISNDDNNYNNGFITKNTLLQLRTCILIPIDETLYLRFNQIMRNRKKLENSNWFYTAKNEIFDLLDHLEWKGNNKQFFKSLKGQNLGGSGIVNCNLIKKYKIFMPKLLKPYRFRFQEYLIKVIFDKYKQHANQRNTD